MGEKKATQHSQKNPTLLILGTVYGCWLAVLHHSNASVQAAHTWNNNNDRHVKRELWLDEYHYNPTLLTRKQVRSGSKMMKTTTNKKSKKYDPEISATTSPAPTAFFRIDEIYVVDTTAPTKVVKGSGKTKRMDGTNPSGMDKDRLGKSGMVRNDMGKSRMSEDGTGKSKTGKSKMAKSKMGKSGMGKMMGDIINTLPPTQSTAAPSTPSVTFTLAPTNVILPVQEGKGKGKKKGKAVDPCIVYQRHLKMMSPSSSSGKGEGKTKSKSGKSKKNSKDKSNKSAKSKNGGKGKSGSKGKEKDDKKSKKDKKMECPEPTFSPTLTDIPTVAPTTTIPTIRPGSPTFVPTVLSPTTSPVADMPTVAPFVDTVIPTLSPTLLNTTSSPSMQTTMVPTALDTALSPTMQPTALDTTLSPTMQPAALDTTLSPTMQPTAFVTTLTPTMQPTALDTTLSPTMQPTALDTTLSTTMQPIALDTTLSPTMQPTALDTTLSTTMQPTALDTTPSPTMQPTTLDTTLSPTMQTTTLDTTLSPTMQTTALDTTLSPTMRPTLTTQPPTLLPTSVPSINATTTPTATPTEGQVPTSSPTSQDSTEVPFLAPTAAPIMSNTTRSLAPTMNDEVPTVLPSSNNVTLIPTLTVNPSTLTSSPSRNETTAPTLMPVGNETNVPSVQVPTSSPAPSMANGPTISPSSETLLPTNMNVTASPSEEATPTMSPAPSLGQLPTNLPSNITLAPSTLNTTTPAPSMEQIQTTSPAPTSTATPSPTSDPSLPTNSLAPVSNDTSAPTQIQPTLSPTLFVETLSPMPTENSTAVPTIGNNTTSEPTGAPTMSPTTLVMRRTRQISPFCIEYLTEIRRWLSGVRGLQLEPPSAREISIAGRLTMLYLEEYLLEVYGSDLESYEPIILDVVLDPTWKIEYSPMAIFSEMLFPDFPSLDEVNALVATAFAEPAVNDLVIILQNLTLSEPSNPYQFTQSINFSAEPCRPMTLTPEPVPSTTSPAPAGSNTLVPTPSAMNETNVPSLLPLTMSPSALSSDTTNRPTATSSITDVPTLITMTLSPSSSILPSQSIQPNSMTAPIQEPTLSPSGTQERTISASDFAISFTLPAGADPDDFEIMFATDLTTTHLETFVTTLLQDNFEAQVETIESIVLDFRGVDPGAVVEYSLAVTFSDSSPFIPAMDDLDLVVELAFIEPTVLELLAELEALPADQPFQGTESVQYSLLSSVIRSGEKQSGLSPIAMGCMAGAFILIFFALCYYCRHKSRSKRSAFGFTFGARKYNKTGGIPVLMPSHSSSSSIISSHSNIMHFRDDTSSTGSSHASHNNMMHTAVSTCSITSPTPIRPVIKKASTPKKQYKMLRFFDEEDLSLRVNATETYKIHARPVEAPGTCYSEVFDIQPV